MCWNKEVSFLTWGIAWVAGLYMINRRRPYDLTMGLLILTYSSMQLWEALIWIGQPKTPGQCPIANKIGTKLAYFALWFHTLAIGVGLYIESGGKIVLPLVMGIGFILVAIGQYIVEKFKCSVPDPCSKSRCRHLVWGFNHSYYVYVFVVCISICLVYIRPLAKALVISALFVVSFILSALYARQATGSFWCFVAAAFAPIFVLINR